jgi:hypothetical protein
MRESPLPACFMRAKSQSLDFIPVARLDPARWTGQDSCPSQSDNQVDKLMQAAQLGAHWSWRSREARWFVACGLLGALALLVVIPLRIFEHGYLNYVSGAWAALADDFSHGVLYRPLNSELGYGGTRYFPLHVVIHGALHDLGLSLMTAGHLISLLSAVGITVGGAIGLRRQGVPWPIAWAAGVLALASRTAFVGVAGIRGDVFPLALGILGLAFVPRSREESMLPSAALLALAVLAKPTLVWAPAAAVLTVAWSMRFRQALLLGAWIALGIAAGLGATYAYSGGQFLISFRAMATAGGLSLDNIGVFKLARPGEVTWVLCAALVSCVRGSRSLATPFGMAFPICLLVTLVLGLSPGIHINHFVDVVALAALCLGAGVWELLPRRWPRWLFVCASIIGVLEAVTLDGMVIKHGDFDSVIQALPRGKDPILSETPWIPVLAGERPFVLDAYSLALVRKASPELSPNLINAVDACKFRAVVLNGTAETAEDWYAVTAFGAPFREHLLANYTFDRVTGGHAIYLPSCGKPPTQLSPIALQSGADTVLGRGGQPNKMRVLLKRLLPFLP